MLITPVEDPVTLAALVRVDPHRSPTLHLSTIIKDIYRTLAPERFSGPLDAARIGMGLAFEDLLGPALIRVVDPTGHTGERPGEFRRDGVSMSPDYWHVGDGLLEEWKATWISSRDGLDNPKLSHWHLQAKAYVRALGADTIRFRVLWVNDAYAPPSPRLATYLVRYTARELDDAWELIQTHARDMGVL